MKIEGKVQKKFKKLFWEVISKEVREPLKDIGVKKPKRKDFKEGIY